MNKRMIYFLVLSVFLSGLFFCVSCKKGTAEKKPEPFDSSVDGVAVRPLPQMDAELADRVVKEGAVSATADTTDPSDAAGAESLSVRDKSTSEVSGESTEAPAELEAEPTDSGYDDYSDYEEEPNSL